MKTGKRLIACFGIAVITAVIFLCWIFFGFPVAQNRLTSSGTSLLATNKHLEGGIQAESVTLSEAFEESQTLLFKTTHTKVEIFLDTEVLYRYGWEEQSPSFLESPGTLWHMVTIPAQSAGRELQLRLYDVYDGFFGNTPEIWYGLGGACILKLIMGFLPILVINCIILFAGVVSIVLHVSTRSYEKKYEMGSFLYVGFFSIAIPIWSLCQCGCLQMLIPNARVLYFVDFFSFYLFPVPFNLFVSTICRTKYKKGFFVFAAAYLLNMVIAAVIQVMGWKDIFELLTFTHLMMAANVGYVFWALYQEVQQEQNETARRFRLPLYIVMLFAAAELIAYYARAFRQTSIFLPLGTIVFISMIIWMQVNRYYNRRLEEQKLLYYEKLANTDMLTEAMNRNAYENMLKTMEQQELKWNTTGVIMFDVNNMKHINDNYGHDRGDEALRICYRCICQVFGTEGKCYRIGGDEFVYISAHLNDLEEAAARFESAISQIAAGLPYPFSVAVGYAQYDNNTNEKFKDTIRRSDEMMYQNKRKWQVMHWNKDGSGAPAQEILRYDTIKQKED